MESRKKGIALGTITAIVAYNPDTYIKLAVCVCCVILAGYTIRWQGNLDDNGDKNETEANNTGTRIDPTNL